MDDDAARGEWGIVGGEIFPAPRGDELTRPVKPTLTDDRLPDRVSVLKGCGCGRRGDELSKDGARGDDDSSEGGRGEDVSIDCVRGDAFGDELSAESRLIRLRLLPPLLFALASVGTNSAYASSSSPARIWLLNTLSLESMPKSGLGRYSTRSVSVPRGCGTDGNVCVREPVPAYQSRPSKPSGSTRRTSTRAPIRRSRPLIPQAGSTRSKLQAPRNSGIPCL